MIFTQAWITRITRLLFHWNNRKIRVICALICPTIRCKSLFNICIKPSHEGNGLLYAWFLSMHTRVDIILYSQKTERELLLVVNRIYDALCRLEKMANFYDPASELSFVNRTAPTSPVVLSEELYSMIDLCLKYNGKTLGCFDITVHSENYNQNTIQSVHLSVEDHSIYFSQPGVTVNLSGFLKGYALDTIKSILNEF